MPSSVAQLKVLVVDDHEIVRLGVRHLFGERAQIHEAATLTEARHVLAQQPFDLLLLDLAMGTDFGLAALPALREAAPAMKIIVLTSMDEAVFGERVIRAGADGFLMKTALSQTLMAAVERVLAGEIHVSPALGARLMRRGAGGETAAAPGGGLSAKEVEVLRLVAEGLSTRDIAEALNRSVKTIETHKQALKDKLGADSPARLVRLAMDWCRDAP